VKTGERILQEKLETEEQGDSQTSLSLSNNDKSLCIDPDLDFIQSLSRQSGDTFMKCFQCGTCSATCEISPDTNPFPSKEMIWARWGMKDRLLVDSDVWLCYQCNDCSTRCPRGAQPGDVLAAVRRETIAHYAFPRFLGRWVNHARYLPFILGIPALLLAVVLLLIDPIENALRMADKTGSEIVYSYSNMLPHWALNSFFGIITLFIIIASVVGTTRYWKALKKTDYNNPSKPVKSLPSSIIATIKSVISHNKFTKCNAANHRSITHILVFFGFTGLTLVTLWVITSGINPLIRGNFVYPFGFWSPWKLLANLCGLGVLIGSCLIIGRRYIDSENTGTSAFYDWFFVWTLLLVVVSGFATEVMHYIRLEPHRHVIYYGHLVLACALILYLPYSKFAHLLYRTTALIYAEYTGRDTAVPSSDGGKEVEEVKMDETRENPSTVGHEKK
jgi:quinone-modifying oxidoreductase, subunit QmoC